MKRLLLLMGVLLALVAAPLSAQAATYIQDNARMFSTGAKNQATQLIDNLVQRTGKEVLVYTVPSLNGQDAGAAADNVFRQQRANGVLLFASAQDRRLEIKIGQDTRQAISPQREAQIRDHILADFRANKFDQGLIDGVNDIRATLLSATGGESAGAGVTPVRQSGPNWVGLGLLVVLALLAVWVVAGIMRARRQQDQPYFSYGQQPPQGTGGYGQPGYGPGPGFGGGGGFFSGLLGGLGGALLGNALFDAFRPRDRFYDSSTPMSSGFEPGFHDQGWQGDDAGQVSDSSADSGSWGDSGGGDWGGDSGGDGGGDW